MYISPFGKVVLALLAVTLILGLTAAAWSLARAGEAMGITAAEGMTTRTFIHARWRAQKIARITQAQTPQQARCGNTVMRGIAKHFSGALQYGWRCLRASMDTRGESDGTLPAVTPATLAELPERMWAYFEAAIWQALAIDAVAADTCALAPLEGEAIMIAVSGGGEKAAPTSTRTPARATATPAQADEGSLETGVLVEISGTEGLGLRVREAAGLMSEIRFKAQDGERFRIADGPAYADEIVWWQIRCMKNGDSGWAAGAYLQIVEE